VGFSYALHRLHGLCVERMPRTASDRKVAERSIVSYERQEGQLLLFCPPVALHSYRQCFSAAIQACRIWSRPLTPPCHAALRRPRLGANFVLDGLNNDPTGDLRTLSNTAAVEVVESSDAVLFVSAPRVQNRQTQAATQYPPCKGNFCRFQLGIKEA
jgi:hypothetical protein